MGLKLQGEILTVESAVQGGVAVEWSGAELLVEDASDFSRDGGRFVDPRTGVVYEYLAVVEGDFAESPDAVVTAVNAPDGWEPGRVDIYPEALDVVAEVETGASGSIPASVPHHLRPILAEGVREAGEGERVVIEQRGSGWTLESVVGRRAVIQVESLDPTFVGEIESANGKARVIHREVPEGSEVTPPDEPGVNVDDTWYAHNSAGSTVGAWRWDGGAWVPFTIDGQVIANLDAGTITSGSLSGVGIYSPSPAQTPRVEIVGSSLRTVRKNDDGQEVTGISLGGAEGDRLQLLNPDGTALAGFDESGEMSASEGSVRGDMSVGGALDVSALTVDGRSLSEWLSLAPLGVRSRQEVGSGASTNNYEFGDSPLGLLELRFVADAGRAYRVVWDGPVYTTQGTFSLIFRRTVAAGTAVPSEPSISSPTLMVANFQNFQSSQLSVATHVETIINGPVTEGAQTSYRVLLVGQHYVVGGHGRLATADSSPGQFYVEDVGPYIGTNDGRYMWGGGTPFSQSQPDPTPVAPPTIVAKTYTTTWRATHMQCWKGGVAQTVSSSHLQQGYYPNSQRYSSWQFKGAGSGGLGGRVGDTLSGSRVKTLRAWVSVTHTYSAGGGTLYIGLHKTASGTSNPQTSGGGAIQQIPVKRGWSGWITLPTSWATDLAAGAADGLTLGEGAPSSLSSYAKIRPTPADLKLQAVYTK